MTGPCVSMFSPLSLRIGCMELSKTEMIKRALRAGDSASALKIASRFHDRSDDTLIFKRGFDACRHPGFYRQLGKDPDQLVTAAVALLWRRFGS
jgi:hypothetical protein